MSEKKIEPLLDVREVVKLLVRCGLPVADISTERPPLFFGIRSGTDIVAVVGLELFGSVGLLRSLAIEPTHRGLGLGRKLVAFAERVAAERGVEKLFLLTTTASYFFERLDYETADRSSAPTEIQTTTQFAELCPMSSSFLSKTVPQK